MAMSWQIIWQLFIRQYIHRQITRQRQTRARQNRASQRTVANSRSYLLRIWQHAGSGGGTHGR